MSKKSLVLVGLGSLILAACNGFGGASPVPATTRVPKVCPPASAPTVVAGQLQLLAGQLGGIGYADAPVAMARFNAPSGLAFDPSGSLFVLDSGNQLIRKIDTSGLVTTFAGMYATSGSADGSGTSAQFKNANGLVADSSGNLFIADAGNFTIRKITPSGNVTTFAGQAGSAGTADGTGSTARFTLPYSIAIDSSNTLYVADLSAHTIRQITPAGVVSTIAGSAGISGSSDGTGAAARFNRPSGITIDAAGNLYVADTNNQTIRKIASGGVVTTIAGSPGVTGSADGTGAVARFNAPIAIVSDAAGRLSVVDLANFTVRQISTSGIVTTLAGTAGVRGNVDGTGAAASFYNSRAITQDGAGNLFLSDGGSSGGSSIRRITPSGSVTTFAGSIDHAGVRDGIGAQALLNAARGLVIDSCGNLFATDSTAHVIRKILPDGTTTTFAGTAGTPGSTDGDLSVALFKTPVGLGIDSDDNLYVADAGNHTIRRISTSGAVTTVAGRAGSSGHIDGANSAARFATPLRLTADPSGIVYVIDSSNSVRKVATDGTVSTLAGSGMGATDGIGTAASFYGPTGLAVGPGGLIYVADCYNHTIRQITPDGVVTTLAGVAGAVGSTNGPLNSARFSYPSGIAVDTAGTIYVSELFSDIRKISGGVVSTVIGNPPQNGLTLGALPATLSNTGNGGPMALTATLLYNANENAIVQTQKP